MLEKHMHEKFAAHRFAEAQFAEAAQDLAGRTARSQLRSPEERHHAVTPGKASWAAEEASVIGGDRERLFDSANFACHPGAGRREAQLRLRDHQSHRERLSGGYAPSQRRLPDADPAGKRKLRT